MYFLRFWGIKDFVFACAAHIMPCGETVSLTKLITLSLTKYTFFADDKTPSISEKYFSVHFSVTKATSIFMPDFAASLQRRTPSHTKSPDERRAADLFVSSLSSLIFVFDFAVIISFLIIVKNGKPRAKHFGVVRNYLSATFACSVSAVNAAGSAIAISESIFRLRSIPAFLRPFINVE